MTDFYRLPLAERAERLRALAAEALVRWGVRDCEPEIVKYRENAVFRVRAPDGRDAALRVHRHGYHSDAALRSELAWMAALEGVGIDVPAVIPSAAGAPFERVEAAGVPEPRQVDMFTWMPGDAPRHHRGGAGPGDRGRARGLRARRPARRPPA